MRWCPRNADGRSNHKKNGHYNDWHCFLPALGLCLRHLDLAWLSHSVLYFQKHKWGKPRTSKACEAGRFFRHGPGMAVTASRCTASETGLS